MIKLKFSEKLPKYPRKSPWVFQPECLNSSVNKFQYYTIFFYKILCPKCKFTLKHFLQIRIRICYFDLDFFPQCSKLKNHKVISVFMFFWTPLRQARTSLRHTGLSKWHPGLSKGCPGLSKGCPGLSKGCPRLSKGCPGLFKQRPVKHENSNNFVIFWALSVGKKIYDTTTYSASKSAKNVLKWTYTFREGGGRQIYWPNTNKLLSNNNYVK